MSRSHREELLVLLPFQEQITRNSRDKEQILMHQIKPEQLPLKHTLQTVWKVRVAGQFKVWKSVSKPRVGHEQGRAEQPPNAKTQKTQKKHSMERERESVSQWASPTSMHQGGDIHTQSVWGWQGAGFVLRIVTFLLAAVTPRGAASSDASVCHCLLPSFPHTTAPANLPPPLLHLFYTTCIHGLCKLPKTSRKCPRNGDLRHASRAFKK